MDEEGMGKREYTLLESKTCKEVSYFWKASIQKNTHC